MAKTNITISDAAQRYIDDRINADHIATRAIALSITTCGAPRVYTGNVAETRIFIKRGENVDEAIAQAFGIEYEQDTNEPETNEADDIAEDTPASEQAQAYIDAVFDPDDIVNLVVREQNFNSRKGPDRGHYIKASNIGRALDVLTLDKNIGAWVCANPLDGSGHRRNDAVTAYRIGVFESDDDDPEEFRRVTRKLGIPVAAETFSGNKSIHVLARLDAKDPLEYQARWNAIADAYADHGITIDQHCKNAARLTRLAGVMRGGKMQSLLAANFGAESFEEWQQTYEKPGTMRLAERLVEQNDECVLVHLTFRISK